MLGGLLVLGVLGLGVLYFWNPARSPVDICMLHRTTGMHCPGCGGTRATHHLLHLDWAQAWRYNPLWVALWPVAAYVLVSEGLWLWRGRRLPMGPLRHGWLWVLLGVVALSFGVARNLPYESLAWLRPP